MGTVTPGIDALPYEALGTGSIAIVRDASDTRVPGPGAATAARATPGDAGRDAWAFAQTLAGRAVSSSGAPASRLNPASVASAGAAAPPETDLSAAATAIADALATAPSADATPAAIPVLAGRPDAMLLSDLVTLLATALQTEVEQSGLFYESHLAQWAAGVYPATQLAGEPQMRSTLLTAAMASARVARAAMPDGTANAAGATATAATPASAPTLPSQVAAVVRQQLQVLAQPVIPLQVAPWPGARATVRMAPAWPWHPGDSRRSGRPPSPLKPWVVDLRLQTRNLGTVTARVDIEAERVGLRLRADHWTASRLHVGVPQLRRRLESSGVHQADIEVTEDASI